VGADREDQESAKQEDVAKRRNNPKEGIAARLQEIGRETAPLMNDGRTSKDLMDDLYDDVTGLPK
jgi:hypothetical protein